MIPRQNLRIPGPTPIPSDIAPALALPMIDHRGPIFAELINRCTDGLRKIFMTKNSLYILTSSGTGALEASVTNTLSPGDQVLAVSVGSFGDRFAGIAEAYGANVTKLDFDWGNAADPGAIRDVLNKKPDIKAVLVTHNETSTGVTNDLAMISNVVKQEFDKTLLVDAVSSLGCLPLPVDELGIDLVGTSSQKGFMIPPGLAFISVSDRAWEENRQSKMPRYYFDLSMAKDYLEKEQTPWTPNLPVLYALDVALKNMLTEGLKNIFQRHISMARRVREGIENLGLSLFVRDPNARADTVTAVRIPKEVDSSKFMSIMRDDFNIVLGGGQGKLQGKIFRIGHMGYVVEDEIQEVFNALEKVLPMVGFRG